MAVTRRLDLVNLVRELAENRISALELVREALSNAKDHGATHVWLRTERDPRSQVSVLIVDDGEGMNDERLEAFWGVGASVKPELSISSIGHQQHLYAHERQGAMDADTARAASEGVDRRDPGYPPSSPASSLHGS